VEQDAAGSEESGYYEETDDLPQTQAANPTDAAEEIPIKEARTIRDYM